MQQKGLNSEITVGSKRLHVQTSFLQSSSKIISNVFDDGRVVEAREQNLIKSQVNGHLDQHIQDVHQQIVADIELLFAMAKKVESVRHAVSCAKIGSVFLSKGFLDEAIQFFNLTLAVEQNNAEAYKNLGICYMKKRHYEKAEVAFSQALNYATDYADIILKLGLLFLEKKDYVRAFELFEKCLTINPSFFAAHVQICRTLLMTINTQQESPGLPSTPNRIKLIEKHIDEACRALKAFDFKTTHQARTALLAGDFDKASELLENAYEQVQPALDLTFEHEFYLKFMYGGKGKDDVFIEQYIGRLNQAVEDQPGYADLHNNLGIAYLILCRNLFLKALDEFRKALGINPNFKRAKKNLRLAENDGKGFLILLRALLK